MISTLIFLVGIVTAVALNINPKSASVPIKDLNIMLAPNAMDTLQAHGLWALSAAGLSGAEPMFDDSFNATVENKKFEESGLDINSLVHIDVNSGYTKAVAGMAVAGGNTGIANVDVCAP
ncbi:hypothetical protein Daus18300_005408 [Diaporthe australafricana]|uniref:Uncharacterized protein n=1 Tax=Diaporthe australafricana TaxID=127596 RepID=A0ABR3X2K8_9PEZI